MTQIKAKLPLIGDEYYGNPSKRFRFKGKVPTFTDLPNTNGRVFNGDTYYVIDEDETYFFDEGEFKKVEINIDGDAFYEDLGFPKFYESKDYEKDNVVVKYGKLYKFTEPHAAGPWTGTDVTETTVSELISSGEYPDIIAGDLTPKTNTPVATTIKMAMTATGGDEDIKNGPAQIKAIRGNLVKVGNSYKAFKASKFVSTAMNLVDPGQYLVAGNLKAYYFPVQRGAWGVEGTTQENNGYVIIGGYDAVMFSQNKPTSASSQPSTNVEYVTDSNGVKHYIPSSNGWISIYSSDVPSCHITWSGKYDNVGGVFGNSEIVLPQDLELRGIIGASRSVFDTLDLIDDKKYTRIGEVGLGTLAWAMTTETSGEGEEETTTYIFTATVSAMATNGLWLSEFDGLACNGNTFEYRSTEVTSVAGFVALLGVKKLNYELAAATETTITTIGDFIANDYGLTYFLDEDGELASVSAFVDFEFQQGGKDQLFNAVTYQKTLAEVTAAAINALEARIDALEHKENIECVNLIVKRNADINGWRLVPIKPASATAPGVMGDYYIDSTILYICVAENMWKKITIGDF